MLDEMIYEPQYMHDIPISSGMNRIAEPEPQEYITPMSAMRAAIQERAYERLHDYDITISRSAPFFDFRGFSDPLYLGSFSWTANTRRCKWISYPHARDIGAGVWVTPGDIARDYLALKYADRRIRMTTDQYNACIKDERRVPLYAKPGTLYDGAVYFDLTGAYWQIVRAVGWDVDYLPGEYLGRNSDMCDFPFRFEKLARNCLVSIGLSKESNLWTGSEHGAQIKFIKHKNRFTNKVLWRLVCDVLNGVATDVLKAGARYVHTDGYIVSGTQAQAVCEAIAEWGLQFGVRFDGAFGTVRGVGSYQVGDHQSMPYRESTRQIPMNAVYDPGNKWLRWRFRNYVEQADQDWAFFKGCEGYDE